MDQRSARRCELILRMRLSRARVGRINRLIEKATVTFAMTAGIPRAARVADGIRVGFMGAVPRSRLNLVGSVLEADMVHLYTEQIQLEHNNATVQLAARCKRGLLLNSPKLPSKAGSDICYALSRASVARQAQFFSRSSSRAVVLVAASASCRSVCIGCTVHRSRSADSSQLIAPTIPLSSRGHA